MAVVMPLITTAQVMGNEMRSGVAIFTLVSGPQTITFNRPFPNANYDVAILPVGISTNVTITNKTANGFTMNIGLAVAVTVPWRAIRT